MYMLSTALELPRHVPLWTCVVAKSLAANSEQFKFSAVRIAPLFVGATIYVDGIHHVRFYRL